jgi:hypothetical protein
MAGLTTIRRVVRSVVLARLLTCRPPTPSSAPAEVAQFNWG